MHCSFVQAGISCIYKISVMSFHHFTNSTVLLPPKERFSNSAQTFSLSVIMDVRGALSLFSTLRDLCRSVTKRIDNLRVNPQQLDLLKDELSVVEKRIDLCRGTLEKYCDAITTEILEYELTDIEEMQLKWGHVTARIEELEQLWQPRVWNRLRRGRRANRTAEVITEQIQIVRNMTTRLSELNGKLREIAQQNDVFTADFTSVPNVKVPVFLDFSARDTMEGEVKATLLESVERPVRNEQNVYTQVTAVVGVSGMGGVGKTTALIRLAEDADVREKFSTGGIYFLAVGKDATPRKLMSGLKEIVKLSGGKKRSEEIDSNGSLESAIRTTSTWFANRRALFICDDLWATSCCPSGYFHELMGLVKSSSESHIVVSTRDSGIASEASARIVFEPRVRRGRESRGMFMASAGLDEIEVVEEACEGLVEEVLELCAGIPLMLSIAGAQVGKRRGAAKTSLERLLHHLKSERVCLQEEKRGKYPSTFNQAVRSSLATIADRLETSEKFMRSWTEYSRGSRVARSARTVVEFVMDCFHRLCVFPRSARVSEEVIIGMWCITNEKVGWDVMDCLVDFHLLQDLEGTKESSRYGLHDVLLDYCETQAGQNTKIEFYNREFLCHAWELCCRESSIAPDTEDTLEDYNMALGEIWEPETYERCRPWWEVLSRPEKKPGIREYLLENLLRHLKESGRLAEAVGLLSDMRWTKLLVMNGSISKMNADFSLVGNALYSHVEKEPEREAFIDVHSGITKIWEMMKRAWPVLLKNCDALPTHTYGYLLESETKLPVVERYLQSAEDTVSGPWLKPRNAFWHILDSLSDQRTFQTAEEIVNIGLLKDSNNIVAATRNMLFWIDIETMNAAREMVVRNEEYSSSEITAFTLCERTGMAVLGFDTGEVQLRNGENGEIMRTFHGGHEGGVTSVSISGDGRIMVSGSWDRIVRVWNTENGTAVGEPLWGHEDVVNSVAISLDGKTAVSGSDDKSVRVWDAQSGAAVGGPLLGHESDVECVAVSADGRRVVSGSRDETIQVWDAVSGATIGNALSGHTSYVKCVSMSMDGQRVVSGSGDSTVRVWDVERGIQVNNTRMQHESVQNFVMSTGERSVVYIASCNSVRVWDEEGGNAGGEALPGHEDVVTEVAVSAGGRTLVSGSDDMTVRVWDAESGSAVGQPLCGHEGSVRCVAVSADGRIAVSGSTDMTVRVWDVESGNGMGQPLRGHEEIVHCVGISADGRTVVSGSVDCTVRLWDVESGSAVGDPLRGHEDWVGCVAISDDGGTAVSGSEDRTVRVWDVESCAAVGEPLLGHEHWVYSVVISADGRTVVSGSIDCTVRVWDVESASEVCDPLVHEKYVSCVEMSGDERTIISGSADSKVLVWIRSESEHQWSCSYVCSMPGSWRFGFAYWDVENSSEVKGKVYCPFGNGGASSTTFELIQPQ